MTIKRLINVLCIFAMYLTLSAQRCGAIIEDSGFDIWCGDQLCSWELEQGVIAQVPTWHQRDHGVELIGDDVAISQFSVDTWTNVSCIRFELMADIEETASVTLEMDFYDDSAIEFEQIIPTSNWASLSYLVTPPAQFQGIRFRIRKTGAGRAVLAEIGAYTSDQCTTSPVELAAARPDGAGCATGAECAAGACAPVAEPSEVRDSACGECIDASDCAAGQVCGLETPHQRALDLYRACGAPGRHSLGQACVDGAECATGVCCEGICSTCCDAADCAGGAACERRESAELPWYKPPFQCAPEAGHGAAGTTCLSGSDCASGACMGAGELTLCLSDSRACDDDAACATDLADVEAPTGHCEVAGVAHGICQ